MIKTKILIVDDYQENITALANLIAAEDVEIFSARDADGALELVALHEFGVALLDVQMPGTSGFELAKIIRGVKKFKSLPIIFVTAHQEDSSFLFESYQAGAVDCLFKPLHPGMVRSKVRMFVELAQQREQLRVHVRELERLRIEADSANMAKSQFLANMSHEIRTPLAAVMGFSDLIAKENPTPDERAQFSAAIQRNGALLLKLIDDILDLSKIEANKLDFEKLEFDLADLVSDLGTLLRLRAEEKGVALKLPSVGECGGPGRLYVSDPLRIKQVLMNIVGNAIKFTSRGRVEVTLSIQPDGDLQDRLTFSVVDQGVGLSREQTERLFQPFGQADSSTRRSHGGSGLGLVISRQIARALGGDVKLVRSALEVGSTFQVEFVLPRAIECDKAPIEAPIKIVGDDLDASLTGMKILAVDDSPDNLMLISMYLRGSGADVSLVESGREALEEVKRKGTFDVILMDVQMPGMDGHETTETIRRSGYEKPVIALTAHAINEEFERCKRSGCDAVLTKPINRGTLIRALADYRE